MTRGRWSKERSDAVEGAEAGRDPLLHEPTAVRQDERVRFACCNHGCPNNHLTEACRRCKHSGLIPQQCCHSGFLFLRQRLQKRGFDSLSRCALVTPLQRHIQAAEQVLHRFPPAAMRCDGRAVRRTRRRVESRRSKAAWPARCRGLDSERRRAGQAG
jgi:hypothetical protein